MSAGEREAAIKVSLDSAEFLGELRRMAEELKRKSEEGKRQFKGIAAGVDAAKSAMSRMAETAKRGLTFAAGLGGTFSAGAAIKGALELDARYRSLAFRAQAAGKSMMSAAEIQQVSERAAAKASRSYEEMSVAFDQVFSNTGDLEFTRDVIEGIGRTATGTCAPVEALASLASTLKEKFGVAAKDMDAAFATVFGNAQQGGPKLEEFAAVADTLGANLLQAGLEGTRGLNFLMGSLNNVDDRMGGLQKGVKGVGQLLLNLGKGSELKAMAKDLGIDPSKLVNEKDAIARLMKILSFGKAGLATLKANFVGPEEQKALKILFTDPFEEALNRAKARGLKGKDAVDQALKMLQEQIGQFGKTSVTAAKITEEAAKNQKTPAFQLTAALNTLRDAVAQPAVIQSINELALHLPALARALGNFLSFAARHPILAGTLGIAGNVGTAFLGGLTKELMKGIWEAHTKGGVAGAQSWLGKILPTMPAAGTAIGVAARASMVLGAGAIGFAIGNAIAPFIIDPLVDKGLKKTRDVEGGTEAAIANASGGGSTAALKRRLARLQGALSTEEGAKLGQDFGGQVESLVGGRNVEVESSRRVTRGRQAETELRRRILASEQEDFASAQEPASSAAPRKMALEPGAPRAIGVSVADALGGRVLQVRIVNGGTGGVAATGRSFGGRGPLNLPSSAHGGGT